MRCLKIVYVLMILIIGFPISSHANGHDHWGKLDQISDQALQLVKQERYEEAKGMLDYFSEEFLKVNLDNQNYSMDELRVITVTHDDALEAINSTSLTLEERVKSVTQFRLVIDAIRSEHQPLWTEMEYSIMTTFNQMKETVVEGNNQTYQNQLDQFISKYDMIHPSLKVDVSPLTVQRLDSHISFLDSYRNEGLKTSTRLQQMEQMELDLRTIFDNMSEDEADPSLIWVMISTGSVIILTLSYVAWRKYKGDKHRRIKQRDLEE
ncbi:sporulation protein YpjB [Litchfieldia salsa]|uniref:Sporulation protein YpjB n=1 Tax=Litchfieldia salsa TaxID=930152 RepID=A0A1H0TKZ0_9BACI|nr:sporulation protein YpjB [Litchfieldia salsa]SDP54714.1 sporulation protein YpjB [Litchfieldia salsa]